MAVATTAAVLAAGATVYSATSASSNTDKQIAAQQALANGAGSNVFGSKIKPVKYKPLWDQDPGYGSASRMVINGDTKNEPVAAKLSAMTNADITASSKARINGWDPTMMASLSQLYQNRNNELQGNIPYEDAVAGMASRNRMANDNGQAGGASGQVAADLGLTRLGLMKQGSDLSSQITQILNGIDPIARYSTPQDYQVTPAQAIPWQIADAQFGATFKAQQNAIAAMADPAAAGQFNLAQFQAGLQAQGGQNNAQQYGAYAKAAAGLGTTLGNMYNANQAGNSGNTGYAGYGAFDGNTQGTNSLQYGSYNAAQASGMSYGGYDASAGTSTYGGGV